MLLVWGLGGRSGTLGEGEGGVGARGGGVEGFGLLGRRVFFVAGGFVGIGEFSQAAGGGFGGFGLWRRQLRVVICMVVRKRVLGAYVVDGSDAFLIRVRRRGASRSLVVR